MSAPLQHGLLILLDRLILSLRPATNRTLEWLRDAAEPPTGLELRSGDGRLYSGVAAFERNKLVLVLAVCTGQSPAPAPAFQQGYRSPAGHAPSPAYQPRLRTFEDEDPGDGWPSDDPFMPRR